MSTLHKKPGYILFLTISVIAIMTIIATQIFYVGSAYNLYVPLTFEREKARQLALSGISIASAQLLLNDKQFYGSKTSSEKKEVKQESESGKPEEAKKDKQDIEKNKKDLLKTLLLVQNQWQQFDLTAAKDGFDGTIKICITCEDGKINLNKLFNAAQKSFYLIAAKETTEPMIKSVTDRMKEFFKIDVQTPLLDALKKQKQPFSTPMDLLSNKKFEFFANSVFFIPTEQKKQDKDEGPVPEKVYLADLFTVYSTTFSIDPWLLSPSLKLILGLKNSQQLKKEDIQMMLEKISLSSIKWEETWDTTLKEMYGKEYKALPKELLPFLSTKFEPRVFSVVCYGKVGRIEQKLLALLERSTNDKGDVVTVKRIYWL